MKRRIGFLVGIATAGLISTHCSSDEGDDNPAPTGGTSVGGSSGGTVGGGTGGKGGTNVGGTAPTGGTGGTAPTAGKGGTGAGGSAGSGGKGGAGAGGMAGKGGTGAGGAMGGMGGKAGGGAGGASGGASGGGAGKGGGGGGGASGGSGGAGPTAKFSDVQAILTSKCGTAMCHNGSVMHVDLRAQGLYKALTTPMMKGECMNQTLVTKSDAAGSILAKAIQGPGACGANVGRMPKGCTDPGCLSKAQIDTITAWIASGAQEM